VRVNSITGRQYRHDPTLLGWELADEASDPGNVASAHLHAWTNQIATHIRELDPNHLLASGSTGYFGPTSPHLQQHNPPAQVREQQVHATPPRHTQRLISAQPGPPGSAAGPAA
jgi:endo-1,4-beta-mannosidase